MVEDALMKYKFSHFMEGILYREMSLVVPHLPSSKAEFENEEEEGVMAP